MKYDMIFMYIVLMNYGIYNQENKATRMGSRGFCFLILFILKDLCTVCVFNVHGKIHRTLEFSYAFNEMRCLEVLGANDSYFDSARGRACERELSHYRIYIFM